MNKLGIGKIIIEILVIIFFKWQNTILMKSTFRLLYRLQINKYIINQYVFYIKQYICCIYLYRCSVTCEGTQLHNINSYQFIDSPEWMASTLIHGESMFQVWIKKNT